MSGNESLTIPQQENASWTLFRHNIDASDPNPQLSPTLGSLLVAQGHIEYLEEFCDREPNFTDLSKEDALADHAANIEAKRSIVES